MKTKTESNCVVFTAPSRIFNGPRIRKLEQAGFYVLFCSDASEAFRLIAEGINSTLLVTDNFVTHGPDFSEAETESGTRTGLALLKRLRKFGSHIPVLIFSTDLIPKSSLPRVDNFQFVYEGDDITTDRFVKIATNLISRSGSSVTSAAD